jgi:hypothetical protein
MKILNFFILYISINSAMKTKKPNWQAARKQRLAGKKQRISTNRLTYVSTTTTTTSTTPPPTSSLKRKSRKRAPKNKKENVGEFFELSNENLGLQPNYNAAAGPRLHFGDTGNLLQSRSGLGSGRAGLGSSLGTNGEKQYF